MSEVPTPGEVEEFKQKSRMVASLVREHYEALRQSGFDEEEAFELAQAYHWNLIGGGEEE